MNKETVKLLQKAKQVLLKNKWTQGSMAKKANGRTECPPLFKEAKCFCAAGAVVKVCNDSIFYDSEVFQYLGRVCDPKALLHNRFTVENFNDNPKTTKKDVLKKFDEAIALAKKDLNANKLNQ